LTQAFIAELQQLVRTQGYGLPDEETNISAGTGD
jgi:hypothetical protein